MNPEPPPPEAGPWARFRHRHLWDYPPAALRWFTWLVGAGALLAAGTGGWLVAATPAQQATTLAGLLAVVLAGLFPVRISRTTHSFSVSDLFVFLLMAQVSVPAAALAAALDAAVGGLRTSRRRSSHLSGPAAALVAVGAAGLVFEGLRRALPAAGLPPAAAEVLALCAAAPVWSGLVTLLLLGMVARKQGQRLTLAAWLDTALALGVVGLASAFVAALVSAQVHAHGPVMLPLAAAMLGALVMLIRAALARVERDRQVQEQRLAEAQREAQLSQQRFEAAFTHAAVGMAIVHADGRVLQANAALADLLGRPAASLAGQDFAELLEPGEAALLDREALAVLAGRQASFSMELRCRAPDGEPLWVALHCSRFEDPGDAGACLIHQLHDITSRHLAEARLHHTAYHDSLTDLANRRCFHERLGVAVERQRTDPARGFAVIFLDLDRFKTVNDSLGHAAGNALLREVAQRLRAGVRPGDLVARLGGDEFAVLLEDLPDATAGERLAERLLQALAQPVAVEGTEVVPGASLGITFSDLGPRGVDELLRDADLAMYEAKAGGRGRCVRFDRTMHARVAEKLLLEADLRRTIGEGGLALHYQPLFELEGRRLAGFEALARWEHPQRGPVSPAVFVALAEETGQIEALTGWVLDHALGQLAQWRGRWPAAGVRMNVNVSGRDLEQPGLAGRVCALLARHGVPAGSLTLEITETTLMSRLDLVLPTLQALREAGVRLSIDDFGTGHSSLAYLSTLPIDSLKIDRSFVAALDRGPQGQEIVRAVLTLGQALGRQVVAEGVETPQQLALLRRLGVTLVQGYLLSRPLPAAEAGALLAAQPAVSEAVLP